MAIYNGLNFNGYKPIARTMDQTRKAERGWFLDRLVGAALGLCEEPRHPCEYTEHAYRAMMFGRAEQEYEE
jgi:hypothetical protein